MRKNATPKNLDAPFLKIDDAAYVTGLSRNALRTGCKDGSVPHTKVGNTYFVNIPALLKQLGVPDADSLYNNLKGGA